MQASTGKGLPVRAQCDVANTTVVDLLPGIIRKKFFGLEGSEVCASGGGGGGYLIFFKPTEEKPFHKLKLKDTARDMSLHPDGLQVATAHWDGYVRISRMEQKAAK